jgi:hypothetical protein
MEAKSFSMATFLLGRGHKVGSVRIDAYNKRPFFSFPDAPDSEGVQYHKFVDLLTAMERVEKLSPKAGA